MVTGWRYKSFSKNNDYEHGKFDNNSNYINKSIRRLNMTKIVIISGFLGVGKTTLILKLLPLFNDKGRIVIIENEFGTVGIDGDRVKNDGLKVLELTSGCICCSLAGDLTKGMAEAIDNYNPEWIIIEPTGVARLSDVIKILTESSDEGLYDMMNIVTVVDVPKFIISIASFGTFYADQIKNADIIYMSKTEDMSAEAVDEIILKIKEINADAAIIDDKTEAKQITSLITRGTITDGQIKLRGNDIEFDTASFDADYKGSLEEWKRFLSLDNFQTFGQIIRVKGCAIDTAGDRYRIDYSSGSLNIIKEVTKADEIIVIIGIGFNKQDILNWLDMKE